MHLFYTHLRIYSTPVWRPADLGSYHHSPLLVSGVLATSACTLSALLVALGPGIRIPPQFQDRPRLEPSSGSMEPVVTNRPLAPTRAPQSEGVTFVLQVYESCPAPADSASSASCHASRQCRDYPVTSRLAVQPSHSLALPSHPWSHTSPCPRSRSHGPARGSYVTRFWTLLASHRAPSRRPLGRSSLVGAPRQLVSALAPGGVSSWLPAPSHFSGAVPALRNH